MINLPRLELADHVSPFDEAVLTIGGREEETITIECTDAHAFAERLALYVNHHGEIVGALQAAVNLLRSIEGAQSPAHAVIASGCALLLEKMGVAA